MQRALLIIDMQNDYFPGGTMELAGIAQAADNARHLLEIFRARQRPVLHVQHFSIRPGAAFFLPGTTGADIHTSLTPAMGEPVIQKHFPNAFRDTVLLAELQKIAVEELIICGAMTHMCIDTTVRAAFDLGFRCMVASDACATRNLEHAGTHIDARQVQAAFMAALASPFAQVLETPALEKHLR